MDTNDHGLRLITVFEGKPRLKARLCEGGAYEVGYGCTYLEDGSPVGPNTTITPDRVPAILAHCMAVESAPVERAISRPLNSFWRAAFRSFGYNIGGYNVVGVPAAALTLFNEGREQDAAAAFVGWISATSERPSQIEKQDSYYRDVWSPLTGRWIGPDGQPCEYRRKMRGLLRRRLAEGCVALGYDFEQACANDAVHLQRERVWNAGENRWEDRVISKTELKDVLPVARQYPLRYIEPTPPEEAPAPVPEPPMPAPVETAPLPPVVREKDPVGPDFRPDNQPKDIRDSTTARGMSKRDSGLESVGIGTAIGAVLAFVPGIQQLTAYLDSFSIETILKALAVILLIVGLWRFQIGKIMFHHGRKTAKGPKV